MFFSKIRFSFFFLILLFICIKLHAFQNDEVKNNDTIHVPVQYNAKGFELLSKDRRFMIQIGGRLQFRYAYPNDQDPITFDDFDTENRNIFKINRTRLKVGGHAYQPWLKYYFEYELGGSQLLDFRIMVEKWPCLSFKIGQWKTEYSRERVISSGNQQMMERSLINRPFTLDRQQGITVYGHLDGAGLADFNYFIAALTGNGIGARDNDDENLMYSGRLQWNFIGEGVPMSGSALIYQEDPIASLALAGATNTSQYTRFSSAGGGSLEGFERGDPGQYTVDQWLLESAFKYRSFSWHSEYHRKQILDNINNTESYLRGYFLQGGWIFNHSDNENRPLLEIAMRYTFHQPNLDLPLNSEEEYSLAFNCFFNRHLNKLTADVTVFDFDDDSINREASGFRFRVQYDISF